MPYMQDRAAATYDRIIFRVFTGNELVENAVVDGTQIPLNGDLRRILEVGTIMIWTGAPGASKVRPIAASAGSSDEVQTIVRSATPDAGSVTFQIGGFGSVTLTSADVSAATFQAAIRALNATLATATVGLTSQTYTVTFVGVGDVPPITVTANTLTASAVPVTLTIATTNAGAVLASQVAGVVMHTTEFWPDATTVNLDDEPLGLYTKWCNFASDQLTGYSGNANLVKSAMTGAGNQRCAYCTFEP